jgi:peptide/nickel transport system ATP-binding protein
MSDGDPLLSVRGLTKHYPVRSGLLRRVTGTVRAVDGIDLDLHRGESLALVGESGCGKSTAARTLLHLEEPTGGTVRFDGDRLAELDGAECKRFRRRAQILLQDPESSFNPRLPVGRSLAEPMEIHGLTDRDRQEEIVADLLERVGLDPRDGDRYPHEFSGGEKQRLALARTLVFDPDLLVADEPVSALDERVKAAILSLLEELQTVHDLAIIVISHDIRTVRQFCDRIAVMYLGELVERGPIETVLENPQHPYTRVLVESVPTLTPDDRGGSPGLKGDVPSAASPPDGCRFHTRCPAVVPPEEYDISPTTYHGIVRLRAQLESGSLDAETVREVAAVDTDADPSDIPESEVRASIRGRFDLPESMADPDAERRLTAAVSTLLSDDSETAAEQLDSAFESVCETYKPSFRRTVSGEAACHWHDSDRDGAPDWIE